MTEQTETITGAVRTDSPGQRLWFPRRSRADVQLIGRVGADPQIRFAGEDGNRAWARFSVATEAPHAAPDVPDWHTVIVRHRLAEFVARHVTRGRLVHVIGWLTYRVVENRHGAHRLAEIHASNVLLLDSPAQREEQRNTA